MIDKCPNCGWDDDFYFNEYNIKYRWSGIFKEGTESMELVDSYHRKTPVYGYCGKCRKRFKLLLLKGNR